MTAIAVETDTVDLTLERARSGDHDAFAQLVSDHQSMVYSIPLHFFRDADRAADVAQDAFLQLYRSLADIEDRVHLVHWLRQVTSRRCIDIARRARFQLVPLEAAFELASPPTVRDPFLSRRMVECIAALPDAQRILVILRYQEDLGPNEISAIVEKPVNTVKCQLHRALRALRAMLEKR